MAQCHNGLYERPTVHSPQTPAVAHSVVLRATSLMPQVAVTAHQKVGKSQAKDWGETCFGR